MTNSQQIAISNLRGLGFTMRQANFLYLVGTNTGVFTMEHWRRYTGTRMGQTSTSLIDKLSELRYLHRTVITSRFHLLRLINKEFYGAILTADSRLRRPMSGAHVRQRLQYLDFIIDHPIHEFYGTEQDKISFFCDQFNVPQSVLPSMEYYSKKTNDTTVRYFPERFPVFSIIDDAGFDRPGISYGEDPRSIFRDFRGFLYAHHALFAAISNLTLVYISPKSRRRDMVQHEVTTRLSSTNDVITDDLMRFFTLRQHIENGTAKHFTRADYDFWDYAKKLFLTPQYDRLYEEHEGSISLSSASCARRLPSLRVEFFEPYTAPPWT